MVQSYNELQTLIWQELMDIIGSGKGAPPVRISWPKSGAPDWKIMDDVIFMQLAETDDEISIPLDYDLENDGDNLLLKQGTSRVFNLRLNAYGPKSYENLLRIRIAMVRGRKNLRKQKIFPVPERTPVIKAPELFQGRWWNRADMTLKFNVLMIFKEQIGTIETVNVVVGANRQGDSNTVLKDTIHTTKK